MVANLEDFDELQLAAVLQLEAINLRSSSQVD
jgi:hypothetical protein